MENNNNPWMRTDKKAICEMCERILVGVRVCVLVCLCAEEQNKCAGVHEGATDKVKEL